MGACWAIYIRDCLRLVSINIIRVLHSIITIIIIIKIIKIRIIIRIKIKINNISLY